MMTPKFKRVRIPLNKIPNIIKLVFSFFQVSIVIYNVIQPVHSDIEPLFNKEICDPLEFYQPYVKVSKTRKGPVIKGIYETGKLMVDEDSGLLCINGAALLYMDDTTEPQIFSHGCFGFNRRNIKDYQAGKLAPVTHETNVFGNKIYGVFLLADPLDFRRTQFNWFRHSAFGHFPGPDVQVTDASFAIVVNDRGKSGTEVFQDPPGPNSYCFTVDSLNVYGKITGSIKAGEKPMFCYQRSDPSEEFYQIFMHGLVASDYIWIDCPEVDPEGESTEIDDSAPEKMPDFRIIDPTLLKPEPSPGKPFKGRVVVKSSAPIPFYSRPYPPGYFFKGEPGYQEPVTEPPDEEPTSSSPLKKVNTELNDCDFVPEITDPCGDELDEERACELLNHVLTIDEVKWKDPDFNLVNASWRKDILTLVTQIYQKVCPQVSKGLAPAVTRVVEYFLYQVANDSKTVAGEGPGEVKSQALNGTKRSEWDTHLIPDLTRCLANAVKMPFYRTRDLANEKRKKEIEMMLEEHGQNPNNSEVNIQQLEDMMRDVHIQFPYFIWLPPPASWNNMTQIRIQGHIEAAEIDYNLDWAIDTFWKIFSTVLGYCNQHYTIRSGDTFKQLYTYFSQDFLDLIVEQWSQDAPPDATNYIFGNFEAVYSQLFGEFVNGIASRYIDACNDGAYWSADVPDFRPVRPLYLKDGSNTGGSARPVNFFVEHPLFFSPDPDPDPVPSTT